MRASARSGPCFWSACAKLMISKLDWPVVNFPELAEKLHLGPAGHARGILAKRVTWAKGKELLRAIGHRPRLWTVDNMLAAV